jgi:hypothetical protein
MRMMRAAALAVALLSCTARSDEVPGRVRGALLGGRPSGEDENAAVLIETIGETDSQLCSGRLVAPRLVLTVRHCLLKGRSLNLACNADGSPRDVGTAGDQSLEPPERMTVLVGSDRSALRRVAVREALSVLEVGICKSDIAFLVLVEDALDTHALFRREAVRIGDEISVTGWGYTADGQTDLPSRRSTLDALRVEDVGPGFIPAGTFATRGSSLCYGDSGAVALLGGSVVGVYSRLEGTLCSLPDTRNVLTATATQADLVLRAFRAVGEEPRYEGEGPPEGPCAGCADAGSQPSSEGGGCSASRRRVEAGSAILFVGLCMAALRRGRFRTAKRW